MLVALNRHEDVSGRSPADAASSARLSITQNWLPSGSRSVV